MGKGHGAPQVARISRDHPTTGQSLLAAQFHSRARSGHFARCRARSGHAVRSRATSGHRWACRATSGRCRAFGRHFAIGGSPSVRKSPDNGCGVRKSPGGTGGTPRAYESRPATSTAPVHVQKPPENADGMPGKCPKPPANVAQVPALDSRPMRPRRPRLQPLADARQLFSYEHVENPR